MTELAEEPSFHDLLAASGAFKASQESRIAYLLSRITGVDELPHDTGPFDLELLSQSLEAIASESAARGISATDLWNHAFLCRRLLLQSGRSDIVALVRLAADGILAERRPEVMLVLRDRIPPGGKIVDADSPLDVVLEMDTYRAFLLLARRRGWQDLRSSQEAIARLRDHQARLQRTYLENQADKTRAGIRLIARFNLAKIVDIASSYTAGGQPSDPELQIDKHEANISELLKLLPDSQFESLIQVIIPACREIVGSSIWRHTRQLGQDFRKFVSALASTNTGQPTLELWPSQRAALDRHLLDPAKRAIVVEMPTSAGKTLLAEFSIVQAHALNRDSTVAYIVPTRALVNQITQRLRRDFRPLDLVVESAAPVFELDPTEDQLLRQKIDVLVCTPEKLDLLVKSSHKAVRNLSLTVVDEAHNIGDGERGVRIELLLGTLKRERPEVRFLMLTPFVPNADELGRWLGDGADATIAVHWRPSERVVTATRWEKTRNGPRILYLETMDSPENVDVPAGHVVELFRIDGTSTKPGKANTSAQVAVRLAANGSVLVLVKGRGTAEARAKSIAELRPHKSLSPLASAVANYIAVEGTPEDPLVEQLRSGVAYHHAGVSHDVRYLLERLIEEGDVDIVCGTTTLAQGLNFPISSVILETTTKSQGIGNGVKELTYSEFWNIAGRAGRALQDSMGLIVFPTTSKPEIAKSQEFLRRQALDVCSYLMEATSRVSDAVEEFNLKFVRENAAMAVFLQYLAHVARVGGAEETSRDIEELLRSSLVYHQTRQNDRALAEALISLSRSFMRHLEGVDRGFLALADNTGFSLPSAQYAFAASRDHPQFRDPSFWDGANLFGSDLRSLTQVVDVLAGIPELSLGIGSEAGSEFNAGRVAGIVRDWVRGHPLSEIADNWFYERDSKDRLRAASTYVYSRLIGQIPWGMNALHTLASGDSSEGASAAYAGAMVFYGVPSPEGVTMRIAGVPRPAAIGMGSQWGASDQTTATFHTLRQWIAGRTSEDWSAALPPESRLTGQQCKLIWQELVGWA